MLGDGSDRAVTPLLGNLLLVAVALVIAVTLILLSATFLQRTGTPTAEAAFEIEESPAGLSLVPEALGTDVDVELNGERITHIPSDDAGEPSLIPTAPGDRLTIVSRDEDRSVRLEKRIDDRSEIGDFIALYRFDAGSGSTLHDQSGNDNDGTLQGSPAWTPNGGGCLEFDGTADYVSIENISAPLEVDEFTVAVTYRQRGVGTDSIAQLVEHSWSGNEWFIETEANGSGGYRGMYAVGFPDAAGQIQTGDEFAFGDHHVAVGTSDGNSFELYVDGQLEASGTFGREVDMGDMNLARDFESSIQYFAGDMCEVRLYYTAFDAAAVQSITAAMD